MKQQLVSSIKMCLICFQCFTKSFYRKLWSLSVPPSANGPAAVLLNVQQWKHDALLSYR